APVLVDLGSALRLPLPAALRRALERRALAKLRARFERRSGDAPARAAPEDLGRDLKVAGTRFRVHERGAPGSSTPVLLLPEAGFSARLLEPVALELARAGRHTLAVDLPGFGGSRRRVATLEPERLAAQLDALLQALRLRHADVCAAGFGARVARALAARAPARIGRVLAIAPSNWAELGGAEELRARLRAQLPAALPAALRGELEAELAETPAQNLALALRAARGAPTPGGVSWDEALAPGRIVAELARS
ncbi:MAG TPA: alpha/beta fold hydrolase, partial [Myxococcota bacterium]|nr:alpha/beta fold hydrolase [Myxococcota bacterium]